MESIDVKGAGVAEHGMLLKTPTATPVPMETVLVPVDTAPAVAVSGVDLLPHYHTLLSSKEMSSLPESCSLAICSYAWICIPCCLPLKAVCLCVCIHLWVRQDTATGTMCHVSLCTQHTINQQIMHWLYHALHVRMTAIICRIAEDQTWHATDACCLHSSVFG